MKRGRLVGIVCVFTLLVALIVAGCAEPTPAPPPSPAPAPTPPPAPPPQPEVFELTFANPAPMGTRTNSICNVAWINWLERESGGRIKVTLLTGGEGAAAPDLYDAARTGIVDIGQLFFSLAPGSFPLHDIGQLPLLFGVPDARTGVLTMAALHEKYPEFQAAFSDVQFISYFHAGSGHVHTVDKPVHTLEDMKGLILIEHGSYDAAIAELLGAEPAAFAMPEVFDAVAKGIADGIDTNYLAHRVIYKTSELCNYTTETALKGGDAVNVMNLDTWNSLPPDLQALFVGENAWNRMSAIGYDWDMDNLVHRDALDQELKARGYDGIYTLPAEERARWVKALQPMYDQWIAAVAPIVGEEKAKAMLEDARKFAQEYQYTDAVRQECKDILHEWGAEGY